MSHEIKEYKKHYNKFNKEFFKGELPDISIKIEKMKGKNAVGEFVYTSSLKYSGGKKEKFFDIKKAVFHNRANQQQKDEWADIIADSYIALPKDAFKKGKYYWASILLHEMCHVYQRLVSPSMEQADHGHDFRKKVDEINKKSNNEWRVGYEEIDAKLVSDKPLNERPENFNESVYYSSLGLFNTYKLCKLLEKAQVRFTEGMKSPDEESGIANIILDKVRVEANNVFNPQSKVDKQTAFIAFENFILKLINKVYMMRADEKEQNYGNINKNLLSLIQDIISTVKTNFSAYFGPKLYHSSDFIGKEKGDERSEVKSEDINIINYILASERKYGFKWSQLKKGVQNKKII